MTDKNDAKKHIGVYLGATDTSATGDLDSYYIRAYKGLFHELITLGYDPVIVYDEKNNYLGDGKFKRYWQVEQRSGKISFIHRKDPIKLKFIYDKNRFSATDIVTTAPPMIKEVCLDKHQSYLFAPELHAESFLISTENHLKSFLESLHGQKIAIKELFGHGGKKVFVDYAEEYKYDLELPLLVQHFLDTSIGIPGICTSLHDLRVIVYNGEIISLLLREPRKNRFKANMSTGGKSTELDISRTPKVLEKIAKDIDAKFNNNYPVRLFSVDFGNTPDGWKIFELNSYPGLGYDTPNEKLFTKRLAGCLASSFGQITMKESS